MSNTNFQKFLQPGCHNTCLSCESAIYNMKFYNNNECHVNECPDVCNNIITNYIISNPNIVMYINNLISTCETCARIGHCGFNDCRLQENAINESVINTLNNVGTLHIIRNPVFEILDNISADIINYDNLNKIYLYSDKLSKSYLKVYNKVIGKDFEIKNSTKLKYKMMNNIIGQYKEHIDNIKKTSMSIFV
jgi:hypothetical protein